MPRLAVALLAAAALTLAAAPTAAPAKSRCSAKAHGHAKKKCKKKRKPAPKKPYAFPLRVNLLDGSSATLTIAGGPPRTVPLSGGFKGEIPGGYQLGKTNTVVLTSGALHAGAADVLTDDCAAPPLAAVDPATLVTLAPKAKNTATLRLDGSITATATTVLRTVLDIRNGDCGTAPVTAGYADTPLTATLSGNIGHGLSRIELISPDVPVTINACLTPGAPTTPCAGAPVTYPVTMSIHLVVAVLLGQT